MALLGAALPWRHAVRDDVLLLVLPAGDPLQALRAHRGPALVLSPDPSALEAAVILTTGGHGYLPASTPRAGLREAVHVVVAGGLALSAPGAAGLYTVLGLVAGNEDVRAAAALAARGMPWETALRTCHLHAENATRALEDVRLPPGRA